MNAEVFDKKFDDNKILTLGAINLKPTSSQPLSPQEREIVSQRDYLLIEKGKKILNFPLTY